MFIDSITMQDFRCFEQAETTFVYPGKQGLPEGTLPNVTLLMGINGCGKTSTLKAIALLGLQPILSTLGYRPYLLVRRTSTETQPTTCGAVGLFRVIENEHGMPISAHDMSTAVRIATVDSGDYFPPDLFDGKVNPVFINYLDDSSPSYFQLGYGATRRAESIENLDGQRSKRRHPRYQRVAGLFEDYITLYPLAAWYPTLESKARAKEVRTLLNSLLPEGTEFTGTFQDAEAVFAHNGVPLPFGALSDGYRSYIGLVADMLYHLNHVCPKKSKLTDLTGVVLIDDIDVHLHPKWQREVVPKLADTFPNLQFIITSHSPLVAGTLHAANIRVVEDNKIAEYTERIHGLTSDQILTSSYFGLDSTRAPAAVAKLADIAARVADTQDPKVALEYIRELTGEPNGKKKPKKSAKP